MLSQNQVGTVPTTNLVVGVYPPTMAGKSGERVQTQLHGKYAHAALSGNVFMGATLAAGIVVPEIAVNMVSTFTLHNPRTSGKIIELIDMNVCQVPSTNIVTGLGLAFQGPLNSNQPASITHSAGKVGSTLIGSGAVPKGLLYTAATLVNTVAQLSPVLWLYNNVATTVITQQYTNYAFAGKAVLRPDSLCTLVDSITLSPSAAAISITWAEYPV